MKKQLGFTIVELVVVIIILGILAATALPRFIDVSDDAHDSVIEAVAGGLSSGAALWKANYVANSEPVSAAIDTVTLYYSATGYPDSADGTLSDAGCAAVFTGLLAQAPPVSSAGGSAGTSLKLLDGDDYDWYTEDNSSGVICAYYYGGRGASATGAIVSYNTTTGAVTYSDVDD